MHIHTGAVPRFNDYFGVGKGYTLLQAPRCIGNESNIVNCTHRGLGVYSSCNSRTHAGVECPGELMYLHVDDKWIYLCVSLIFLIKDAWT